MGWCFAIVNNKLAEIYFDRNGIYGHCYVKKEEFKTNQQQKWIKEDTAKYKFTYRKDVYRKIPYFFNNKYPTPIKTPALII